VSRDARQRRRHIAGGDRGRQRVSAGLERGEAEADRGAEHEAVAHPQLGEPAREQDHGEALGRLLDQTHPQVGEHPAGEQPCLQGSRGDHPEDAGEQERSQETVRLQLGRLAVVEQPEHGGDGDHEASQQDHRRKHDLVVGDEVEDG
jgi:hypothetical protein